MASLRYGKSHAPYPRISNPVPSPWDLMKLLPTTAGFELGVLDVGTLAFCRISGSVFELVFSGTQAGGLPFGIIAPVLAEVLAFEVFATDQLL